MKKVFYLFAVVALFLTSCTEESSDSPIHQLKSTTNISTTPADYIYIGVDHNTICTDVYNAMDDGTISIESKDDLLPIIKDYLVLYVENFVGTTQEDKNMSYQLLDHIFDGEVQSIDLFPNVLNHLHSSVRDFLTNIYNAVDALDFSQGTPDFVTYEITLSQIENQFLDNSNLNEGDKSTLLSAISVARKSPYYWNSNYNNWDTLLENTNKSVLKESEPIHNVVKADIAGAAMGAATAWVTNFLVGPGTVAYGSAIVIGAVGCSVFQSVWEVLSIWI